MDNGAQEPFLDKMHFTTSQILSPSASHKQFMNHFALRMDVRGLFLIHWYRLRDNVRYSYSKWVLVVLSYCVCPFTFCMKPCINFLYEILKHVYRGIQPPPHTHTYNPFRNVTLCWDRFTTPSYLQVGTGLMTTFRAWIPPRVLPFYKVLV